MLTVLPEIIEDQNGDFRVTSARRKEYGQEVCKCNIIGYFIIWELCSTYLLMIECPFGSAASCTNSYGAGVSNAADW